MRIGTTKMLALTVLALLVTGGAFADTIGQVTDASDEALAVVIDGQLYSIARDAELAYEGQPGRLVDLDMLREGQPVRYETGVDDEGNLVIIRMLLLSE